MQTHKQIDERSLALACAVAERIERDPEHQGLEHARDTCRRWRRREQRAILDEWLRILERPWPEVRRILCEDSERGRRLRQSSPFCGILTPRERWEIYRRYRPDETPGT